MAILMALIVGAFIGWLVSWVLRKFEMLPARVFTGIAGAIVGDAIYCLATADFTFLFTWAGLLCQLLGAMIFVFILEIVRKTTTKVADTIHND